MAQHSDIVIRGDGIVGCALALLLASQRLRVGLQGPLASAAATPTASEHSDIRAYALNAASRQLLESLRCWPAAEFVTPVYEMQVCGDHGGQLSFSARDLPASTDGTPPALNWIVQAHALHTRLQEAVRFQPLIAPLPTNDAGSQASASLLVAAEGQASASRAEWGVPWQVQPYAQRAIAARVRCTRPHGQVARQWFDGGDVLAFLPLDNAQSGADGNLVAVVWSVSEQRASALLAADAAAFCEALEAFSRQALGSVALASERASWPLQLARAGRWVGRQGTQSWALVGDAAHTVHPLAGLGLNLGLADAAGLAQVLGAREYWRGLDDMKLLRRYERARALDWLAVAGATDGLQQVFAQTGEVWKTLRNWGLSGVDRSGPVKHWLVRQATGLTS